MFWRGASRIFSVSKLLAPSHRQCLLKNNLHVSAVSCKKIFVNQETHLTSKFIPSFVPSPTFDECKQDLDNFELEENYSGKTVEELVKEFEVLSHYCVAEDVDMSNSEFDHFVSVLIKNVKNLSDDQLMSVLTSLRNFPETPATTSNNFMPLWNTLDHECVHRLNVWSHQKILKYCNLWMNLNLAKINQFCYKSMVKLLRRVDKLPPKLLVETMFYNNVVRSKLPLIEVEERMVRILDELNIDEIGIICLSFFKTENKVKNQKLVSMIYERATKEVAKIEEITIVNILKTLRYSSKPAAHDVDMRLLYDAVLPHLDRFGMLTCLHIALLGTCMQYCHEEVTLKIFAKFNKELDQARLKDIERICLVMGLYSPKLCGKVEKDLTENIVKSVKSRVQEIVQYPRCLSAIAHFLSLCGVYDNDLIKSSLSSNFIKFSYSKSAACRDPKNF